MIASIRTERRTRCPLKAKLEGNKSTRKELMYKLVLMRTEFFC